MIRSALKQSKPTELGNVDYCYIEGCIGEFPEKVIVEVVDYNKEPSMRYMQMSVSLDENNQVVFSDVQEVEVKAAITAKNELRKLEESANSANIKTTPFNEQMATTIILEPIEEAMKGKKKRKGKVMMAQKADMKNENGRVYPKAVLQEAVEIAQKRIEENGPLLMDSQHRVNGQGESVNDIRESVALIKSINFDETTGTVSLPEIEFIETQAGKDLIAVLESGAKLQVSQRGYGSSHTVMNPQTQETHEEIDLLRINGFDFVPGGQAGVKDAKFEGLTEGKKPETSTPEHGNGGGASGGGNEGAQNGNGGGSQPQQVSLSDEDRALLEKGAAAAQTVNLLENQLQEKTSELNTATQKQQVAHLETVGKEIVGSEVAGLVRFNDDQKSLIVEKIDIKGFYPRIADVYSADAVSAILKPEVAKVAQEIDKVVFRIET